jgi:hypothetical protein
MAGVHCYVPRPGTYETATLVGLYGCARSLHAPGINARSAAAPTVPTSRTCSFSRLDIPEWSGLRPTVTRELLQHRGAPATSYLGPGLGS